MHANCPNGDGTQSRFGRFRYYYVNYRTTSKVICIANRRTPYFTECGSLSLNTSLKQLRILYAVAQSVSADSRLDHAPAMQVQTGDPELFFSSSCFGLPFMARHYCLEMYFRFKISLLSILCMLIARMEMGPSRVSGDSDIIT